MYNVSHHPPTSRCSYILSHRIPFFSVANEAHLLAGREKWKEAKALNLRRNVAQKLSLTGGKKVDFFSAESEDSEGEWLEWTPIREDVLFSAAKAKHDWEQENWKGNQRRKKKIELLKILNLGTTTTVRFYGNYLICMSFWALKRRETACCCRVFGRKLQLTLRGPQFCLQSSALSTLQYTRHILAQEICWFSTASSFCFLLRRGLQKLRTLCTILRSNVHVDCTYFAAR